MFLSMKQHGKHRGQRHFFSKWKPKGSNNKLITCLLNHGMTINKKAIREGHQAKKNKGFFSVVLLNETALTQCKAPY